ncbi:plasmid stabilisation system protein [Escherichia coli]|nr:plasmid stabilisation system protein [Escherichia coli]SQM27216.1 plasmid stabilisation system protein [Escherichia coli]
MKTVKLTPKASQDLEDIWFYGYQHFGEEQADKYIRACLRFCVNAFSQK